MKHDRDSSAITVVSSVLDQIADSNLEATLAWNSSEATIHVPFLQSWRSLLGRTSRQSLRLLKGSKLLPATSRTPPISPQHARRITHQPSMYPVLPTHVDVV